MYGDEFVVKLFIELALIAALVASCWDVFSY